MNSERPKIKEVIVVEGKDDTNAIKRAVDAETIETHGFGMSEEMWLLLEKAYLEKGLIVFTDPDYAGNQIRKKVLDRFPQSGEAFISQDDATAGSDIGVENARPEAIIKALSKVRYRKSLEQKEINERVNCLKEASKEETPLFTKELVQEYGLIGAEDSKEKREKLGRALGIGYSNGKALVRKLNAYGISLEEFEKGLE